MIGVDGENKNQSSGKERDMQLLIDDLMAENELLRQQRVRLMDVSASATTGDLDLGGHEGDIEDQEKQREREELINRIQILEEEQRRVEAENRKLVSSVHESRVELLQLAPLRAKISDLNTSHEHNMARLRHSQLELTGLRKELQQAKLEQSILSSRQVELRVRNEALEGLASRGEAEKKALRQSLQDTQQELQNKEQWWHKRRDDDVLAVHKERDEWQARALSLTASLRRVRAQLKSNSRNGLNTGEFTRRKEGEGVSHERKPKDKPAAKVGPDVEATNLCDSDERSTLVNGDEGTVPISGIADDGCTVSCGFF